jgi:CBS domain-containing protein
MGIQNILDRKGGDVFTIEPTATVRTATYLMRARGIAALVVKSGDMISGLISEREVVHAIAAAWRPGPYHDGFGRDDS